MKGNKGSKYSRVDMFMTRVIYPVGLGAFCIERFYRESDNVVLFDMMYDCGSLSKMQNAIGYETKNLYIDTNKPIDLVFLSHFDEDHINGFRKMIGTLAIVPGVTTIMLPQISDEYHLLELIGVEEYDNYNDLRDELVEANFKVVEVRPWRNNEEYQEDRAIELEELGSPIPSGTKIAILDHLWEYIPFNNFDKQQNTDLLNDLMNRTGFNAQKINDIYHGNITTSELKSLKDAYRKLGKTKDEVTFINRNSLLVISRERIACSAHLLYSKAWIPSYFLATNNRTQWPFHDMSCALNASCLYTGDSIMEDKLVQMQNKYFGQTSIGLFQIPHHGSKHCYDQEIINNLNFHAAFVNTSIYSKRVTIAPELINWQNNNIPALFWVLKGDGGIYEYIY